MRTLIVCRKYPSRTLSGAGMRIQQNIAALSRLGQVAVFYVHQTHSEFETPEGVSLWNPHRLRHLAWRAGKLLVDLFRPGSMPVANFLYSRSTHRALESVIHSFRPELIVFEEIWLYRYLPVARRSGARVILDMHNVERPLYAQIVTAPGARPHIRSRLLLKTSAAIEREFVRAVDQLWTCSEADAALTRAEYGNDLPIRVIPNGLDADFYAGVRDGVTPRHPELPANRSLIFCGNFAYHPNVDAAITLIRDIYPSIQRTHPDVALILLGRNPPASLRTLARGSMNIVFADRAGDVRPALVSAAVAVVPLRYGGGTRLKILEAFAAGRPVVCTPKAAEGLAAQHGTHLLLASEPQAMADAVRVALSDERLVRTLTANALELVQKEYSWDAAARRIAAAVESCAKDASGTRVAAWPSSATSAHAQRTR